MNAKEHFEAGNLKEAIASAADEVKKNPTDLSRRTLFCELVCFAGDMDKADKQLDLLGHQDPQLMVGVSLYRQLIRAEQARQEFYADGRVPEFLGVPSPHLRLHLEASILLREGKPRDAADLLVQAEERRPKVSGTCDGKPFDDIRDLDDLTASFFEVLTSTGKYYWVAMDQVELVELRKPARPRDLLWRRAHMIVANGPDGEVYLPTLYAGTQHEADDRVRLGRVTEWRGGDGATVRGIGLRTFLIGDEGRTILEVENLTFNRPAEAEGGLQP
jgi:type VI secretion system protein ImpE